MVINKLAHLQSVQRPFSTEVIQILHKIQRELIFNISTVKIDLTLIDVFIIRNKTY